MDSVVDVRECKWCHKPYRLHDGRYKYCSDECAEAARLAQCGQSYRDIAEALHKRRRQKILDEIRSLPGVERMVELRSRKKYKVRVQFQLE